MCSTYIIAEIAQAHDGSLGILMSLIESAARAGVDAVKFQLHLADYESSIHEPFRVNFSYEDISRFDYWKRMEFTLDQWVHIKDKCKELGVDFLVTPFSLTAVDLLEKLEVQAYKIGSGDFTNKLLMDYILLTQKPIYLSCGMASYDEIASTVSYLDSSKADYALFQCTTNYPTLPQDVNLNRIPLYLSQFNCPIGLSDHTGSIYSSLGAVSLGATFLESHITFDHAMFGPDSTSSLTPHQFAELVNGVRFLEKAIHSDKSHSLNINQINSKSIFSSSLTNRLPLKAGDVLTLSHLEMTKPAGLGIPSSDYKMYLNRAINVDLPVHSFLQSKFFL